MITRIFLGFLVIFGMEARVLILVIASDEQPVYRELQTLWRSYMHRYRNDAEVYFIKGDPTLDTPFKIEGDVVWVCQEESLSPGIMNKTVVAFEAFYPRIGSFDHLLRTNLSSFFVIPRLMRKLKELPRKGCYAGIPAGTDGWYRKVGSGAGYILSPDVLALCVKHKGELWNREGLDDVVLSVFLQKYGVELIPLAEQCRKEFFAKEEWSEEIPSSVFHFRIKHPYPEGRVEHDLYIYQKLLEKYCL